MKGVVAQGVLVTTIQKLLDEEFGSLGSGWVKREPWDCEVNRKGLFEVCLALSGH